MKRRVLVTGAGGVGGVNFIRALRVAGDFFIVGLDHDEFYLQAPDVDVRIRSPRHDDPRFVKLVEEAARKHEVEFIHPQPEVEVEVLSKVGGSLGGAKMMLPRPEVVEVARDKWRTYLALRKRSVRAPETRLYSREAVEELLDRHGTVWIRARKGAGGRLSLPVRSVEEAERWVGLWVLRGVARPEDFIAQEFLPGRDIAWDSLWHEGELVASYARERLRYIFPHLSPSRITGTPTVAKIIRDEEVNRVAEAAVRAVDDEPNGFYCVDLRCDKHGRPAITEVNVKAHTTLGLWGYLAQEAFGLPPEYNMPHLYVLLGLGEEPERLPEPYDIYPEAVMLRHIDVGVLVDTGDGWRRVPI